MAGALMPSGHPAADRLATTEIGPSLHGCLAPIEAIGAPIKPALPQCRSDSPAFLREDHVQTPHPSNNAALTSRRQQALGIVGAEYDVMTYLAEVRFHVITSEQLPNRFHQMMGRAPTLCRQATTNLGVGSSNLSGRANIIKDLRQLTN